eukprot:7240570-Ditylum_brightwellii.AAC.1
MTMKPRVLNMMLLSKVKKKIVQKVTMTMTAVKMKNMMVMNMMKKTHDIVENPHLRCIGWIFIWR